MSSNNLSSLPPDIQPAVDINEADINSDYCRVPGDLAYWGNQYAIAYREWCLERITTKRLHAALTISKRVSLEASGRKVTLSEVDSAVETDPQYQAQVAQEIDSEFTKIQFNGFVDAVRAKRDMLVSLGAQLRAEMGSDLVIRKTR